MALVKTGSSSLGRRSRGPEALRLRDCQSWDSLNHQKSPGISPFLDSSVHGATRPIFLSFGEDAGVSCANSCFFEKIMLSIFSNVTEFARLRTGAVLIVGIEAPQIRKILDFYI